MSYANPISVLQERCQGGGHGIPVYEELFLFGSNGFHMEVKCYNKSARGTGFNKKEAKKNAAQAMLEQLDGKSPSSPKVQTNNTHMISPNSSMTSSSKNFIGELQEFCVAMQKPVPRFTEVSVTGPDHMRTFSVECSLLQFKTIGTGSCKSEAKKFAAEKMLTLAQSQLLKPMSSSSPFKPNGSSPSVPSPGKDNSSYGQRAAAYSPAHQATSRSSPFKPISNFVTSFSTLKTTALLPPVTTKFAKASNATTNRLLLQSSTLLSHQNTSDFLKETNLATSRREQLFSNLLSEKQNLSNRFLSSHTSRLTSNLTSSLESRTDDPKKIRDVVAPFTEIKNTAATTTDIRNVVGTSKLIETAASRHEEIQKPTTMGLTSARQPTIRKPEQFIGDSFQHLSPIHQKKSSAAGSPDLEPIVQFSRNVDEEEEEIFGSGWKQLSSKDKEAYVVLIREKEQLLFEAAVSLVGNPRLEDPDDLIRQQLLKVAKTVADKDPEFILKVVLYCRQELNLRSTSNLLLAFACLHPSCKIHVLRYFKSSIVLPSDWMAVADFIQTFHQLAVGSLPAILRKAMVSKFVDFDEYQLAKYNKIKKAKKKEPVEKEDPLPMEVEIEPVDEDDDDVLRHAEAMRGRAFNLKRLIRVLHISEPVYYVLCLLGKKYPLTEIEFMSSRLPGNFDAARVGKRLKLATPETWETQVAKFGNKAEVWHKLIDNRKLPYMAAIRNLRNLVLSGIDDGHITKVCQMLTNEKMVAKSRLFPFRFYTAYDVLDELDTFSSTAITTKDGKKPKLVKRNQFRATANQYRGKVNTDHYRVEKLMKHQSTMNDKAIDAFRKALDKAVKIATIKNIPPIKGVTLIICSAGTEMNRTFGKYSAAKRSMNKSAKLIDAAMLLALMCQTSGEEAHLWIYSSVTSRLVPKKDEEGEIPNDNSILARVKKWSQEFEQQCDFEHSSVSATLLDPSPKNPGHLQKLLRQNIWIDNLVWIHGSKLNDDSTNLDNWTEQYRQLVNPSLAFVSVDIDGNGRCLDDNVLKRHPKDLRLSGFSETIFHCLASSGSQVDEVENVDKKYKLPFNANFYENQTLPDPYTSQTLGSIAWKRIRVFISSTFLDMHGERDLLNRFVFPELARRGRQICVNVIPIDLRWGLPHFGSDFESELSTVRQVRACLDEIDRCQLFIGFLSQRYGWVPNLAKITSSPNIESRSLARKISHVYKHGMSITELEMRYAALSLSPDSARDKAFFFLRDPSQLDKFVPSEFVHDFFSGSSDEASKLAALKENILKSGFEVVDQYPATFRGIVGGVPMAGGLAPLGQRVLDILWNSVTNFRDGNEILTDREKQDALCSQKANAFVGRNKLMDSLLTNIRQCQGGVVHLSGAPGSGLTSLLSKAYTTLTYQQKHNHKLSYSLVPCFVDAFEDSNEDTTMLVYIFKQLMQSLGLSGTASDSETLSVRNRRSLNSNIANLLQSAKDINANPNAKLILFVDGLESLKVKADFSNLRKNAHSLDWLPPNIPPGVVLVVSTHQNSKWDKFFSARLDSKQHLKVGLLDISDRKEILRTLLSERGKALDERAFTNDLSQLANKREAGNAKYLKLLSDEMSAFGHFDELGLQLERVGDTSEKLLHQILSRMEEDFGTELVSNILAVLYLSRPLGGISEPHIIQALASVDFKSQKTVTPLHLSMILRGLDAFFQPTKGSLSEGMILLKDNVYSLTVEERYWKNNDLQISAVENILGDLFLKVYHDQHHQMVNLDPVLLNSLIHHLSASSRIKDLEEILCNLDFFFHSASVGTLDKTKQHLNAVHLTSKTSKSKFLSNLRVQAYGDFMSKHEEAIRSQPCLTLQLALNEEHRSLIFKDATKLVQAGCPIMLRSSGVLLSWINQCDQPDASLISVRKFVTPAILNVSAVERTPTIEDQYLLAAHGFSDGTIMVTLANTNDDLFSLVGHSSPITALAFLSGSKSSGDSFLVSGSQDGSLSFWDLNTRIRLSSVKAHSKRVTGLAASIDGLTLVSVGYDGSIKVWGGRTRKEVTEIKQESPINCVAHHPDKDFVITGDFSGLVKIWDLTKVEKRAVLRGHTSSIQCVALSWDARNIASSSINGDLIIFDGTTGSMRAIYQVAQCISSLSFKVSGECSVYAGCRNGDIIKWKFDNTTPIQTLAIIEEPTTVTAIYIDEVSRITVGLDTGEVIWNAQQENYFIFKVCNEAITSISTHNKEFDMFSDVVQTRNWEDMLDDDSDDKHEEKKSDYLLLSTETKVFLLGLSTDSENQIEVFVVLGGFSGRVLGTFLMGSTIITASTNGKLYLHQPKICKSPNVIDQPVSVAAGLAFSAHKMAMTSFAAHPTKDWCITCASTLIKLWQVSHHVKGLTRMASINLDEPTTSLAFTIKFDKSYIMASTNSKIHLCQISEVKDNGEVMDVDDPDTLLKKRTIQISPNGSCDIPNGELTLKTAARSSGTSAIVACLDLNGVTVRSNKGAELRRFEGNFGNAVSLASIKGNENCYRLTVWDHHKRRIFIYDVLQGEVDHSVHLTGFTDCVNAVTTLANDMTVFGSSRDKTLRIWRIPAQSIVRDDHVTNVSKDVISLVSIEDGVLSLSENGKLEKWTSNENKIWSSQLLMQMNCGENCKSEKMTSLAAIQLPKQERSKNDFLTSVEDDVYILAATCAEHCRVNLLVHSLQKTSRVRIELGQDENDASEKNFQNFELVPLRCSLGLENLNSSDLWLHLAVGFESRSSKEFKWAINKKKMTDKSFFQNPAIQTGGIATRNCTTSSNHLTSIFFFKQPEQTGLALGFTGKGGCKFVDGPCDNWFTCCVTIPESNSLWHIVGDVDGKIHIFQFDNASATNSCEKVDKLHSSSILSMTMIEQDGHKFLATASKNGLIRLWRIGCEPKQLTFHQVGEFCGRGLPISSLASSVVKMQLVKNEKDKTETFLFASDKFGVYVLSLNFVGKTSLSIK